MTYPGRAKGGRYRLRALVRKCRTCGKPAFAELVGPGGESLGVYCAPCGERRRDELDFRTDPALEECRKQSRAYASRSPKRCS